MAGERINLEEILTDPNTINVLGFAYDSENPLEFWVKMKQKYGDTEAVAKKIGVNAKLIQKAHKACGMKNQYNNSIMSKVNGLGSAKVKTLTVDDLVKRFTADPRNIKNILLKLKWKCKRD